MITKNTRNRAYVMAIGAMAVFPATPVMASDLVNTPINPSFGGNPFNSSHLLAVANAINRYKDPNAVDSSDPAQQFLRQI